ncbi:MAG: Polysaccharide export protein [Bacteroidetes bacterium]|nr:Polysaccharide export protein [Bacteroidota bacterium]
MKKACHLSYIFFITLFISSCSQVKDIAYFQNTDEKTITPQIQSKSESLFDPIIKPKDLLSISVVSTEPGASRIYNLITPQTNAPSGENSIFSQPALQNYLVDNEGYINFPVLGKIQIKGQTTKELAIKIQDMIAPAFTKELPIITVRIINYSVNILGEVIKPGKYETTNERLTIFEGLALAGDMTIYGRRDNVKVLREDAYGNKKYITLNLNDKDIINSEAYFLEQNDVVYVEPNKSRTESSKFGSAENFRISTISVLFSVVNIAATLYSAIK